MTKKKKILSITCGVLAVVVVGSYFALNRNNAVQAMVSTETLQQMDLQNTVSLSGVVESQSGRKVYSTLSYLVEQVNVQVGDVVQQGGTAENRRFADGHRPAAGGGERQQKPVGAPNRGQPQGV